MGGLWLEVYGPHSSGKTTACLVARVLNRSLTVVDVSARECLNHQDIAAKQHSYLKM